MFRLLVGAVCVCLVCGCQPPAPRAEPQAAKAAGAKRRIAVIPKGTTHEFWKSVHFGANKAAQELGVDITWDGPVQESDRAGQIALVRNLITQRVDGICLAPLDSQALVSVVQEARDQGIPVLIFDSGLKNPELAVSYVATDNYRGGKMAAEELAAQLGHKGNVILMRYTEGSESTEQRERGFLETMQKLAEQHPELKILSSDVYGGTTPDSSVATATNLLTKYKEEVNGFFAVCEPNANGALVALQRVGLADKVHLVGFDPNSAMVAALEQGTMKGIVLQDPVNMGYLAVKTMVRHLNGEKVELYIDTGEAIATSANLREPRMQELLNPKQFER